MDLQKVKRALEQAEGYVRAAAWREETEPPYERSRACQVLAEVHDALKEISCNA